MSWQRGVSQVGELFFFFFFFFFFFSESLNFSGNNSNHDRRKERADRYKELTECSPGMPHLLTFVRSWTLVALGLKHVNGKHKV